MKHQGTVQLETERLILRRFTMDDADAMYANWASNPDVTKYLSWPPHASVEESRKVLEGWVANYERPDYYQWAIELRTLGDPVGSISVVSLVDRIGCVEIGYCIMPAIIKIAITGGPCAGKTSALSKIREVFSQRGYKVITVPEPATEFISNGITPWECSSSEEYQRCQMEVQLTREAVYERAARGMEEDKVLIVFDRGMLDNKCYMTKEEFDRVIEDLGTTEDKLISNYDAVFHLVSAAKGAPEFYSKETNGTRYELLEEAAELDDHFIEAWAAHPRLHVIGNEGDFNYKLEHLIGELKTVLDEIEASLSPDAAPLQTAVAAPVIAMSVRAFTGADFEPLSRLLGTARHAQHGSHSYWQGSDELCGHLSRSDAGFVVVDDEGSVQGVVLVASKREQDHNRDMQMHWQQQRSRIAAMANVLGIKSRADAFAAPNDAPDNPIVLLELTEAARAAGIEQALLRQAQDWLHAHE